LLDWSLKKNGCLAAAPVAKGGPDAVRRFSTHATADVILDAVEHR